MFEIANHFTNTLIHLVVNVFYVNLHIEIPRYFGNVKTFLEGQLLV